MLEGCRGEFCYGDKRVKEHIDHYGILGEEVTGKVHDEYLAWLKANCDTLSEESPSGEFSSVAVNWNGHEDLANEIVRRIFPK